MGFAYTNAVWEMKSIQGMSSGAWNVLLTLADMANNRNGECWPSMSVIAARVKLQEKQARIHVHRLEKLGLLQIVKNRNGGRPGSTLHFRLLFEPSGIQRTPPTRGSPMPQLSPPNPSLQRRFTSPERRKDGSLPVVETPPTRGSQTLINHKENLLDEVRDRYRSKKRPLINGYAEHEALGEELGLQIREHDPIESTSNYAKRVEQEVMELLSRESRTVQGEPYSHSGIGGTKAP